MMVHSLQFCCYLQQLKGQTPVLATLQSEPPGLVGGLPRQANIDESLPALGALPEQLGAGVDHVVDRDLHQIWHYNNEQIQPLKHSHHYLGDENTPLDGQHDPYNGLK